MGLQRGAEVRRCVRCDGPQSITKKRLATFGGMRNLWVIFLLLTVWASAQTAAEWRDSLYDYRSEEPGSDSAQKISKLRLASVGALTTVSFAASYVLVFQKGWWSDGGSDFHFENDYDYAMNLDKGGHFFAGVLLSEMFYEGYHWAGLTEFQSYFWAGVSAGMTHVGIDVKDGFSPEYGYSVFDVMSGTIGGFWPMAERYVPAFKYFDYKWSYWINSQAYYDQSQTGVFTDDYVNQTHWLSFKVDRMLPRAAADYWPDWLAVAVGLGIDDGVFVRDSLEFAEGRPASDGGRYEIYVGPDWDLEGLFKPKDRWARRTVTMFNYIKFPMPTLQVYPYRKWHWVYPIEL